MQGFRGIALCLLLTAMTLASGATFADPHGRGYVYDHRYGHDHYYPPRGYVVHTMPRAAYPVHYRGAPYWFHGGVWYRPYGPRFVVIAPPIGVVIPVLPPFYTTVWWRGVPYYYADEVYYQWHPADNGYVVVPEPDRNGGAATTEAPAGHDDAFVYPNNGQSEQQQAADRYECHRWASDQSGFDPTQPQGGVEEGQVVEMRSRYKRAEAACLEGRGYTVK